MGKSQRDKGHGFERAIAREIRELGIEAKRGFQTRGGTAEEPDVKGVGRLWIECKAHKKVNRRAAWIQAFEAAPVDHVAVAICKDDYQKPVVVLPLWAIHPAPEDVEVQDTDEIPLVEIQWEYFKQYLLRKVAGLEANA